MQAANRLVAASRPLRITGYPLWSGPHDLRDSPPDPVPCGLAKPVAALGGVKSQRYEDQHTEPSFEVFT